MTTQHVRVIGASRSAISSHKNPQLSQGIRPYEGGNAKQCPEGLNNALASVQSHIYMTLLATEPPSHSGQRGTCRGALEGAALRSTAAKTASRASFAMSRTF